MLMKTNKTISCSKETFTENDNAGKEKAKKEKTKRNFEAFLFSGVWLFSYWNHRVTDKRNPLRTSATPHRRLRLYMKTYHLGLYVGLCCTYLQYNIFFSRIFVCAKCVSVGLLKEFFRFHDELNLLIRHPSEYLTICLSIQWKLINEMHVQNAFASQFLFIFLFFFSPTVFRFCIPFDLVRYDGWDVPNFCVLCTTTGISWRHLSRNCKSSL